jgi:hypothetical protein
MAIILGFQTFTYEHLGEDGDRQQYVRFEPISEI